MLRIINQESIDGIISLENYVNQAVTHFTNGIRASADPLFHKTFTPRTETDSTSQANSPPWADNEWQASKKVFLRSRDRVKRSPTQENLRFMSDSRRNYKYLSRRKQKIMILLKLKN